MADGHKITFLPDNVTVEVGRSSTLNQAAAEAGIDIVKPCGGRASCHGCKVSLNEGKVAGVTANDGSHLSCSTFPRTDLVIFVPESSRKIESDHEPDIEVIDARPDPPCLEGHSEDDPLRYTAVGMAVNIGEVMINARLLSLFSGKLLRSSSRVNPLYRQDVEQELKREKIVRVIDQLARLMTRESEIDQTELMDITVTGDSDLWEIFNGEGEPDSYKLFSLDSFSIDAHAGAKLKLMPMVAKDVGSDLNGALLVSGICDDARTRLLIKIGSRAHAVVSKNGRLAGASVMVGGVFEGGGIRHGMRLTKGAIDQVLIKKSDLLLNVLGGVEPKGISGAGILSAVSEMLSKGIIDSGGTIAEISPSGEPEWQWGRNIREGYSGMKFVLWSRFGEEVSVYQEDIDRLLNAVRTIRGITDGLLKVEGLGWDDFEEIVITGALGKNLSAGEVVRIGLLPDIDMDVITLRGNLALEGVTSVVLSRDEERKFLGLRERYVAV